MPPSLPATTASACGRATTRRWAWSAARAASSRTSSSTSHTRRASGPCSSRLAGRQLRGRAETPAAGRARQTALTGPSRARSYRKPNSNQVQTRLGTPGSGLERRAAHSLRSRPDAAPEVFVFYELVVALHAARCKWPYLQLHASHPENWQVLLKARGLRQRQGGVRVYGAGRDTSLRGAVFTYVTSVRVYARGPGAGGAGGAWMPHASCM